MTNVTSTDVKIAAAKLLLTPLAESRDPEQIENLPAVLDEMEIEGRPRMNTAIKFYFRATYPLKPGRKPRIWCKSLASPTEAAEYARMKMSGTHMIVTWAPEGGRHLLQPHEPGFDPERTNYVIIGCSLPSP